MNRLNIFDIGDVSKRKYEEEEEEDADEEDSGSSRFESPSPAEKKQGRFSEISLEEAHFQQRSRIGTAFDAMS